MDFLKDLFWSLFFRSIGDKDYEKVFDIVFKVEKYYRWGGFGKFGVTLYERNTEYRF